MSITTPVTKLLGIDHPILLAPMDLIADGRLAAAVHAAGGFVGGNPIHETGDDTWDAGRVGGASDAQRGPPPAPAPHRHRAAPGADVGAWVGQLGAVLSPGDRSLIGLGGRHGEPQGH